MNIDDRPEEKTVLLKIQNSNKPQQTIVVVVDHETSSMKTEGLKDLFGVKEILIDKDELLRALPEYAEALTFLLQSMSAAEELHLPYGYQDEFHVGDSWYSLLEKGEYRVLKRLDGMRAPLQF